MKIKFHPLLMVIFFLFNISVYAQRETGAILGYVTDANEQALSGVTISIANLSRAGWNSVAYSNQDGYYRFAALPPGFYEIKAELGGFQTVIRKDVRLFVGTSITIDFTLELQSIEESISVTEDHPTIDVVSAAVSKTIPPELIENLPRSTDSVSLFSLTPGVGEELVAYGAAPQASGYWFDGVDVSDPTFGGPWQIPNYNWIEEVQVVGLGAPAEYGGFTGVISNSITRSGGNLFHGLFETFFQNESLTGNNTDDPNLTPPNVDLFTDTTFQLGGPILRDKLWFFTGVQYFYSSRAPVGYPAFQTAREPKFINKMTFRADQDNTLQGFIEYEDYYWKGVFAGPFTLPEATAHVNDAGWFWNASWMSILSPETVLDVRTSGFQSPWDILPQDINLPGHIDWGTGIRSVNRHFAYVSDRGRNQVNVTLSNFARDFIQGHHEFKFGVQYEHDNAHQIGSFPGGVVYYDYYGDPFVRDLWSGYDFNTVLNRISSFAQDEWAITDNLNLSIGFRWDHNNVNQDPSIKMITNPIAPRLGFVYDLRGNQKTVIKAHYGHYHASAITFFVDQSGNVGDHVFECFDSAKGEWLSCGSIAASTETVDPDIKQQYTQQFTFGLDQQFPGQLVFGAHYIYRKDRDLIEDVNTTGIYEPFPFVNPLTGETMTLFRNLNLEENQFAFQNPSDAYRQYHGLQITADKRFSNNFTLRGSVVISKARGNLDNTAGGASGFSRQYDSPNLNINFDGRLTNDVTLEIKVMGYYDLPWGIRSSGYYRHFSGDTWTPRYRVDKLVNENFINVFLLPRGSNRMPSRNVFDVRAEKSFRIYNGDLSFIADIFNLFNTGYPLSVVQNYSQANFEEATEFSTPREIRVGVRYKF